MKSGENVKRSIATIDTEKKVLEQQQNELENRTRDLAQEKTELKKQNEELKDRQRQQEKQLEDLNKKIADLELQTKNQSQFMMIVLKWSSAHHDLDLTVTDPAGHAFNFKNRKFSGVPGEFTLDSRSGPGAEIWQTDKIIPGIYTVAWKLYNNYGNEGPVVYSGIISTNKGNIQIAETKMESKGGAKGSLKIKVDAAGSMNRLD